MRKVILPIHPFIFIGMYLESGLSIGVVKFKEVVLSGQTVFSTSFKVEFLLLFKFGVIIIEDNKVGDTKNSETRHTYYGSIFLATLVFC